HYVLQKAGFKPVENKQTQLYEAIVKIIDDNRKTASLTQKGETKLYTGYDSQSEDLALTPKTGYQLKQLIDSNTRSLGNVIPNSKKSSVVNSNSNDTVATSAAVKTAYDKAVSAEENNLYQKIYVGKDNLQLDLTDRQQLINLFGYSYRINGHLSFTAHNNAQSNITGLPLTTKSPIAVTFYIIGGYSSVYCHYPLLGRSFFSRINFNNTALTYKWIELLTNTGEQTINNQLVLATRGWSKIKFPIDSGGGMAC
ncbi:TPA: phage tail protein, partial [Haemophilus influenzae]